MKAKLLTWMLLAVSGAAQAATEADYVHAWCPAQPGYLEIEHRLPDKTRIDCLTETMAIEVDWAKKWAEGVGQAIYYGSMTGKRAGVALIMGEGEIRFYYRAKVACRDLCDVLVIDK